MESPQTNLRCSFISSATRSAPREVQIEDNGDGFITEQEWQGWGAVSPVPSMVKQVVEDLKILEQNIDAQMNFGGIGGKLQACDQSIVIYLCGFFFPISIDVFLCV